MTKKRQTYPREFKLNAIQLAETSGDPSPRSTPNDSQEMCQTYGQIVRQVVETQTQASRCGPASAIYATACERVKPVP